MPLPDTLAMMRQLVGIPSVSSVSPDIDMGNLKVVELLAEWLQELNFTVEIIPLKNHPEKANLVATLGRGQGGLVLAGHTDTVPYDENLWNYNPLALTEAGNRLYGMGSSDMKGFFALAITAARIFSIDDLKEPLVIVATADEESTMHGARELAASGRLQARRVLIGEPTGLRPVHMHKGMMMESVHLHGCSGHSSDPALGNNAMEGMHSVIAEILRWRTELQQRFQNPDFKVPFPTLNLGRIAGGDNPNRTAAEKLTGSSAESAAYSTEAPFFQNIGLDAVVLGPGDIAQAHQPDEFLALDRLQPMIDVLTGMIRRFCVA